MTLLTKKYYSVPLINHLNKNQEKGVNISYNFNYYNSYNITNQGNLCINLSFSITRMSRIHLKIN